MIYLESAIFIKNSCDRAIWICLFYDGKKLEYKLQKKGEAFGIPFNFGPGFVSMKFAQQAPYIK